MSQSALVKMFATISFWQNIIDKTPYLHVGLN